MQFIMYLSQEPSNLEGFPHPVLYLIPDADNESDKEEVGMEFLLHPEKDEADILSDQESKGGPNREITDIAAAAQMLQPTGYTLETTEVW